MSNTSYKEMSLAEAFWFQEGPGVRQWQFRDTGIKLLNVANILKEGGIDLTKTVRCLSKDEIESKYSHFLCDEGDLVIASSGISVDSDGFLRTRGSFIKEEHLPLCMNTSTIRFKQKDGISHLRYLKHWLQSLEFRRQISKEVTGIAQKNFGPSHLKRVMISLPPLSEQKRIADILDKADEIREKRKQSIAKLDDLLQSVFLDMFGEVLASKDKLPLSSVCEINPSKNEVQHLPLNTNVTFLGMSSLTETGEIQERKIRTIESVKNSFTYFRENDVLFAKITPCMENGKGAIARDLFNGVGFGSTEFHVLRPISSINSEWLHTFLSLPRIRKLAEGNMTGTAGQRRVPVQFFDRLKIAHPKRNRVTQYAAIYHGISQQKHKARSQAVCLDNLFSSLQQKAFKGEL